MLVGMGSVPSAIQLSMVLLQTLRNSAAASLVMSLYGMLMTILKFKIKYRKEHAKARGIYLACMLTGYILEGLCSNCAPMLQKMLLLVACTCTLLHNR